MSKKYIVFCLKISFNFSKTVDPDEIQRYAPFHLGHHCLQKYSVTVYRIQKVKDKTYKLTEMGLLYIDYALFAKKRLIC